MVSETYVCQFGHEWDAEDLIDVPKRNICPLCGGYMSTIETTIKRYGER